MFLEVFTELDASPERVWQEIKTTRLLQYVAQPLLVFDPIEPQVLPKIWQEDKYLVELKLFGFLSFGKQWINISILDTVAENKVSQLRDNGQGDLIKKWDHSIVVEPTPTGKTKYTDRLELDAGILTPPIWLSANLFFKHRQKRWQKLVRNNFDYSN